MEVIKMKLFRKKEEKKSCCCEDCTPKTMQNAEKVNKENGIKILGSGCTKCIALENATRLAISEMGLDIPVEHVTDFAQIATYGVMSTPAIVIDGKVVSYGKVLSVAEVKTILNKMM